MSLRFEFGVVLAALPLSLIALPVPTLAQVVLPEIVVVAPSPIQRPQPSANTSAATPPVLLGELPIVTDQFATVTVVPDWEIQRSAGSTLGDILSRRPGISASTFAPGAASRPIVRGLDNYRIRIQENGLAINDVSELGEDHGVPVDPLTAQQIEVIRGPATLRWGSQAIGGVVNVDNNRIPSRIPQHGISAEFKGALSTVDAGREGGVLIDAGGGGFAFHADAFGRRAQDYRIPGYPYLFPEDPADPPAINGKQPNSSLRADGYAVGGSNIFNGGFFGVSLSQYDSLYRVPGIEATETNTRIDMTQTRLSGKGEYSPQSSTVDAIRFWLGVSDYKHNELANEGGFDGVQQSFINKAQEGRVEVQLMPFDTPFARLTTALGIQAGKQKLDAPGAEGGLFDRNRTKSVAGYIFNEFAFNDLVRMQIAGRIEHVDIEGTAPDFPANYLPTGADPVSIARNPAFTPKSAAVGLLHDLPSGMVVSVTAQHVERAPRAPELLSRGVHEATGTFDIGDPNLKTEVAHSFEAGLRRRQGPFRFELTGYYTRFDGFIFRSLNGNTCDEDFASCVAGPGGELNQAIYSQRDAIFRGAEFQGQLDLTELGAGMFGIDGQYDIVRATFADGGNVPRTPPQRLGGGVYWRDAAWFARVGILHAFPQRHLAELETETGSYDLLKAELSYTRKLMPTALGPREIVMGVTGNNLLDNDVRNHVSFKKDEVLLPGTNVRFFISVKG